MILVTYLDDCSYVFGRLSVTYLDDCYTSGRWRLHIWTMEVTYLDECYISGRRMSHIWTITYLHATRRSSYSCGDTCQIWMWFKDFKMYFYKIETIAYGEISERALVTPPQVEVFSQCAHTSTFLSGSLTELIKLSMNATIFLMMFTWLLLTDIF